MENTITLDDIYEQYPDEMFMSPDGLEGALMGVEEASMRLIYSSSKCIKIFMEDGMDYTEAVEYFEFNTKGAYIENGPIFMEDEFH